MSAKNILLVLRGLWGTWGILSVGWIGYEARTVDKTMKGQIKTLYKGMNKAIICALIPPLGIMLIRDEYKNLDFRSFDY